MRRPLKEESNKVELPKFKTTKERYIYIYRLYISSRATEEDIARQLEINSRTVSRAINYCISLKELRPSDEKLKLMIEQCRERQQILIGEIADLSPADPYQKLQLSSERLKYYIELRKTEEFEAKICGLLREGIIEDNRKITIIHNIGGVNGDKNRLSSVTGDREISSIEGNV